MHVTFCTDENYAPYCGIAIISLLENNCEENITIHLIGANLSKNTKSKIQSISDQYNVQIIIYDLDITFLRQYNFSLYNSRHINLAAYIRLFITKILPIDLDKVLYLDCDLIIVGNLIELWNTNIDDYSFGASIDSTMVNKSIFEYLGYDQKYGYINSGVLLINLKYWRDNNVLAKCIDFYNNYKDKIKYHDQDILNGALFDSMLLLPIEYNVIDPFYQHNVKLPEQYRDDILKAIKRPKIIHFTTSQKPWFKDSLHPKTEEFLKYKNISPWRDLPIKWNNQSISKIINYYKRLVFYKLGLKKHKYKKI